MRRKNRACPHLPDDQGARPVAMGLSCLARANTNFRTALWTGEHLQLTVMCIPPCEKIGAEVHHDLDQLIRVESGRAQVCFGTCKGNLDQQAFLCEGDVFFIPAHTYHNVFNVGRCDLKLSSVYCPKKHPFGTVHRTRADAEQAERG